MITDDTSQIECILNKLKQNFYDNKTKDLSFRKQQLLSLKKGLIDMKSEFQYALNKDLGLSNNVHDIYSDLVSMKELDFIINNMHSNCKPVYQDVSLLVGPAISYTINEPLGVVLILSAWNYPVYTAIPPVAAAIATGNCLILKPSDLAPFTSNVLKKLFELYLDNSYYCVIEGQIEVAKKITSLKFDLIFFTGSAQKGRLVALQAANHLTPCILELGGKNPCIVDKDADLDNAALRIAQIKFVNCGQTCVTVDYVFVHTSIKEKFLKILQQKTDLFFQGNAQQSNDYSKVINQFHMDRLSQLLQENHQGQIVYKLGDIDKQNLFFPPTIVDSPSFKSTMMKEEIFGPILPIIAYKEMSEVINHLNQNEKPLSIYYYGSNFSKEIKNLQMKTSSGSLVVNECGFQVLSELPFGGVGNSGQGAYHGKYNFDAFSHKKAVLNKLAINVWPLSSRYPPYTTKKFNLLMFLMKYADIKQKSVLKFFIMIFLSFLLWKHKSLRNFLIWDIKRQIQFVKILFNLK